MGLNQSPFPHIEVSVAACDMQLSPILEMLHLELESALPYLEAAALKLTRPPGSGDLYESNRDTVTLASL
jgi:hypothetical protein